MHLSQSVVLWQGRGGIQKIGLFGKRRSPYYVKNSSNKQRETTIHCYFKTWRSVNAENVKTIESAVAKTIKRYEETGSREDRHRNGRPRVSSAAEDKFIRVTSLRNCSLKKLQPSSSNRHISTWTVQMRLRESGLHGWIAAKKPLAWAKKHEQCALDRWKSVLWSDELKFDIFGSNCRVFVRRRVGEWMISACVVPTMKHGGGVMVLFWWHCLWFI